MNLDNTETHWSSVLWNYSRSQATRNACTVSRLFRTARGAMVSAGPGGEPAGREMAFVTSPASDRLTDEGNRNWTETNICHLIQAFNNFWYIQTVPSNDAVPSKLYTKTGRHFYRVFHSKRTKIFTHTTMKPVTTLNSWSPIPLVQPMHCLKSLRRNFSRFVALWARHNVFPLLYYSCTSLSGCTRIRPNVREWTDVLLQNTPPCPAGSRTPHRRE
jgi:hypothetical protein